MTAGAQQALRRTMELHSATTRFALACNISSKVIEPIQSRCAIVRFMKLTNEEVLERVRIVAERESVPFDAGGLEAIVFTADGDMRQALNNLQATHFGFTMVSQANVFRVCDQPHPLVVAGIVKACLEKDLTRAYWDMNVRRLRSSCAIPLPRHVPSSSTQLF